ncbi:ATP-dependent permease [Ceratobasidium theobromae]|uniref:histidinol-phosphatase n=1 Tax=Ceratobasidium theobromae TaxID=1582974 RepID=A0A5N5QAL7_9AGAM|nr:ATP-dependent permease [Ceratobasidium theobromae]
MKHKASYHSHSGQFCKHASGTLEQVVQAAIAGGFQIFGLTEHVPRYRLDDLYPEEVRSPLLIIQAFTLSQAGLTLIDLSSTFDQFVEEAHRLKAAYANQITLLVGLETEYITDNDLDQLDILLDRHAGRIEYVVGSVHHCNGIPIDFDKPNFERAVASFQGPSNGAVIIAQETPSPAHIAFLNEYFDAQLRLMERIRPEVIGHFDLCRLYTPGLSLQPVWSRIERNVRYAIDYGAAFELNAAAFRKGWDTGYPGREMVELIQSCGGRFVQSDDSHGPAAVGLNYDRLETYIKEMGITRLAKLERGDEASSVGRLEPLYAAVDDVYGVGDGPGHGVSLLIWVDWANKYTLFETYASIFSAFDFSRNSFARLQKSHYRQISFTSNRPASLAVSKFLPQVLRANESQSTNLRQMIALARPEKKTLLVAVGLLLISSSVTMSVPLTFGKLIDFFSHGAQPGTLPIPVTPATAVAGLFALFTIGAVANAGRVILMRSASARIVARLRSVTYSSALRQDIEFLERSAGPGDVVSRLNADAYIVGDSLTGNLSDGLRALTTATIGLSLMFYISPTLTALMLAIVPPVSLGAFAYGRYLKRLSNRTQEGLGEMTKACGVANEALSAVRTVQAFTAAPREEVRFNAKVSEVKSLAIKEARAAALFFGATGWSGNVVVLGLLAYGGSLVSRGLISVGDLTSLLMYTAYVGGSLSMLSSFFSSLMKGLGASERIFQLLQREPAIRNSSTEFQVQRDYGDIKFDNVSFSYPSRPGAHILRGFSMNIKGKGDSVALVWRSAIGIVPQDPVLFSGTIAENIAYGCPEATLDEIQSAARLANCDFVWDMPHEFDTQIGRDSLSGGQRQRIAIARALLKKPVLLCLDEATSALDALSELRVNEAIERILKSQETSTLIVAHRLSTISRAGRIVVLEDGQVTEEGTYQELVSDNGFRYAAAKECWVF